MNGGIKMKSVIYANLKSAMKTLPGEALHKIAKKLDEYPTYGFEEVALEHVVDEQSGLVSIRAIADDTPDHLLVFNLKGDFLVDFYKSQDEQDLKTELLWEEFANVTFIENTNDDDGSFADLVLSSDWHVFEEGTGRESIWHWFDDEHSKGVAYLLYDYVATYNRYGL
jgi:hypothetical protein